MPLKRWPKEKKKSGTLGPGAEGKWKTPNSAEGEKKKSRAINPSQHRRNKKSPPIEE
jgi:hypothetical protein